MDYFAHDEIVIPEKGDILISEPYLPDPNFERTVIYLCEHDENGTFGFVLNKKSKSSLSELLELDALDWPVHIGGPVQQDTLHFIHTENLKLDITKEVSNGIFWGIDFEGLMSGIENRVIDPQQVKFLVGYSGWSVGQLMDEINAKSWIICKQPTKELVFETDPENLWSEILKQMGGKFKAIANYPIDPSMN